MICTDRMLRFLLYIHLGYKPDPLQKAKFEYSPLGELFPKGLDKNERQQGLLKRLKNIEDKTDNQLVAIRDQGDRQIQAIKDQIDKQSVLKSIDYSTKDELPEDVVTVFDDLVKKDKTINYKKLNKELGSNDHDFTMFSTMGELLRQLYYGNILIPAAERDEDCFYEKLEEVKRYNPLTNDNINKEDSFLNNIQNFYDGREMVIDAFANEKIPLADGSYSEYYEELNLFWLEHLDKFEKILEKIRKESSDGFNIIIGKKKIEKAKNISLKK